MAKITMKTALDKQVKTKKVKKLESREVKEKHDKVVI